jgi:hypothetical protein
VFSKTGTWLSKILRIYTNSKYVHVSLAFDKELTTMYSFGRINPKNPFSGGFVKENIQEGIYKISKDPECIVYRIKITEQQYNILLAELNEYDKIREELRYNFLGLIAVAANVPLKREKYYFCSQFVSQLLIKIDVLNDEKPPELTRPTDLMVNVKDKEEIFKGYIREYKHLVIDTE